jgi:hypothetical protein
MITVASLRTLGIDPAVYGLSSAGHEDDRSGFEYFRFHDHERQHTIDDGPYDLVGIRVVASRPLLMDMRLVHIPEECLDPEYAPGFEAERDASGLLGLSPPELGALITFLGHLAEPVALDSEPRVRHFIPLGREELANLGVPPRVSTTFLSRGTTYYRYIPATLAQTHEDVQLISLSQWTSPHRRSAAVALKFMSFKHERLADPGFDPLDARGIGLMRFDASALHQFIALLKEHEFRSDPSR